MPTTALPTPTPPLPQPADRFGLAAVAGVACLFALAELLLGLAIGGFADERRAEAIRFLELRPWLLVAGAAAAARLPVGRRLFAYAAALLAAGLNEAVLSLALGNGAPWAEMLRGWAGAVPLLAACDAAVQLAARFFAGTGRWTAAAALAGLLLVPPVLAPYRTFVAADSPPVRAAEAEKPALGLMTALPIVWGEGGAFDPNARPAASYRALQEAFRVEPLDSLDRRALQSFELLLLAQPRWLAADELVALDGWVRAGGKAVILTDPRLDWHSALPLGDIRRPPPVGLLKPLLDHWGLALAPGAGAERRSRETGGLLAMAYPGRFTASGGACKVERAHFARCRVGAGQAVLIADADLLRDELWLAPGKGGGARHRRLADNPMVIAALLDGLGGIRRAPVHPLVARWRPDASAKTALAAATLPLLAAAMSLFALGGLRRREA